MFVECHESLRIYLNSSKSALYSHLQAMKDILILVECFCLIASIIQILYYFCIYIIGKTFTSNKNTIL